MIRLFASIFAFFILQSAALAETIAITGGKLVTNVNNNMIANGTVIIRDGRIIAVGEAGSITIPQGATQIDASGKWVTPGIFVPFSQTGLVEISAEASTNDIRANKSQLSVALLAADSFNPKSTNIASTRIEGITRMAVLPDASATIFGGRGALVNTSGSFDSVTKTPAFLYLRMGEAGARIAGGSRSAAWGWLRQAIAEAKTWRRGREPAEPLLSEADAVALQQALDDDLPFLVGIERASDIIKLIEFKAQYDINVIIVGGTEAWMVADEIKAAGIAVILDPHNNLPQSFETLGATMYNAKRLHDAGVSIAIASLGDTTFNTRLSPQHAGNTLATGLPWAAAFHAITTGPAMIFGVNDTYGRLAPGMVADVVVWDGDPLELMTSADVVVLDGKVQSMQSRQTKLRDRYLSQQQENGLPHGYR
ncbi:MAG: amidohydrolase family protein [Robiginitomaculum sp.]|nr:amidohydrolase family protein [Robiginitomaculum sp.]